MDQKENINLQWLGLKLCHCTSLQCAGFPKLGKSYSRRGWSRTGGTPLCAWGEGGRAVPWTHRHCCCAGNRVQIPIFRWENILQAPEGAAPCQSWVSGARGQARGKGRRGKQGPKVKQKHKGNFPSVILLAEGDTGLVTRFHYVSRAFHANSGKQFLGSLLALWEGQFHFRSSGEQ